MQKPAAAPTALSSLSPARQSLFAKPAGVANKKTTMKTLFVLAAAVIAAASAETLPNGDRGPSQPIVPFDCSDPSLFVVDEKNQCWYYQCSPFGLIPRPCALGTHVHSFTRTTRFNPCTERFPIQGMFDCTRGIPDPLCNISSVNCRNGGTPRSEGSYCWCECPAAWTGAWDCSVASPPNMTVVTPANPTCPPVDWCGQALPNRANPCQNNGKCINQCTNFICDCPRPFSKDRYCTGFSCSTTNSNCPTGTSCNRGLNGRDEFFMCM